MKKHLVLVGHIALDPCHVVLTTCADLEPGPETMTAGTVRITVVGGETVELAGEHAAAWWRYVEQIARRLDRRILTSHGQDVEPAADVVDC